MHPRPRLVLVHGTRMTGEQWSPVTAQLNDVEVVAPDLPGHGTGASSSTREPFTLDSALAVIDDAVAGAAADQPVVLAGHSLGGYLATAWAARGAQRLAGLVLIGCTAVPTGPGAMLYRGFGTLVPLVGPERMARVTNRCVGLLGAPADVVQRLPGGSGYAALPAAWSAVMETARPEQLDAVRCPVLIVNGQLDQMRLHVRRYAERCPQARVVTIPRATHLLPLTHPQALGVQLQRAVDQAR